MLHVVGPGQVVQVGLNVVQAVLRLLQQVKSLLGKSPIIAALELECLVQVACRCLLLLGKGDL